MALNRYVLAPPGQQLVCLFAGPFVGLADLTDKALPHLVQFSESAVDRVDRVTGAAARVRVRLAAAFPDSQPHAEDVYVAADRGQRAVVRIGAGGHLLTPAVLAW